MKKTFVFWVNCILLLLSVGVVDGATYHVATDGIDTDAGSEERPWRTIQKAASTMVAGDKVFVKHGEYDERIVTSRGGTSESNRISFKATGRVVMRGFSVGHPFISVEGFEITGHSSADVYDGYIEVTRSGDHFRFLTNFVRDGIYLVSPDIVFHDNEPAPDTITCESGGFLAAGFKPGQTIFLQKGTNNVTLANTGTRVISSVSDDTLTVDGSLADDGPVHAYITGSYVYGLVVLSGATNCLFQGNSFTNLSFDNWFVGGVSNLFEGNTLSYCHGWDAIHVMGTDHVFRGNLIRNSPLVVYQISPDAFENWPTPYERILFERNFIENFAGVFGSQKSANDRSRDLLIRNNVFVGVGRFTTLFTNTSFINNTFLRVAAQSNPVISVAPHPIRYAGVNSVNPVIQNNIFVDCGEGSDSQQQGWYDFAGSPANFRSLANNFVSGPAPSFDAKAGFTEGMLDLNGGDPGFVNIDDPIGPDGLPFTEDDGLRLRADSKLRNAGVAGVSLGAYPYVVEAPALTITPLGSGLIRLSWPALPAGFELQVATAVAGSWSNSNLTPSLEGDSKVVLVQVTNQMRFYRLFK